jgi:cell division protein FtsQ
MDYNPPNTRERVAARRQQRRGQPPPPPSQPRRPSPAPVPGQQAIPGARQALLTWAGSGRLVGLLICLAACGALAYMLTDERFRVREVTVEGNSALHSDTVTELAAVVGRPIWFLKPEDAVARLGENAYVASAAVELALPDRATIRIVERRPEVRWQAGGVQYLVDRTGKVLGPAQEPAAADVLVIADNSHPELKPNEQIDLDAVRLAQDLALRLPVELGFTPAQIGWDFGLGVYARSAAGQTIVFGRSEDLSRKLAVLGVLLQDQTPFTYLDLRPANPFYQNTGPGAAATPTPAPESPSP